MKIDNKNIEEMSDKELQQWLESYETEAAMNGDYSRVEEGARRKIQEIEAVIARRKKERLQVLKPVAIPEQELLRKYRRVEKVSGNFPRVGGGVFQINAREIPEGWIVQCAFAQRDLVNHKGEPLPDGGMFDEEATKGLDDVVCDNREIEVYGYPATPNLIVAKTIDKRNIGFVTRERCGKENDSSIETVMPIYTPGVWLKAKDTQYERQIVLVEIDLTGKMNFCNFGQSKNEMSEIPASICTEKVSLALRIASDIGKVLNE